MNKPYLVGLTGGIASGKDLVADILRLLGAKLLDADQVYRELISPGGSLLKQIAGEFGQAVLNPDGGLNRKALGSRVFGDQDRLSRLNAITHPPIIAAIKAKLQALNEPLVFLVAPLLLEAGKELPVDEVWVVAVPDELQIKRLMKRDGISSAEALKRVNSQLSLSEKVKRADIIIDNSGSRQRTGKTVEKEWQALLNRRGIFDFREDHYCFACGKKNPIGLKLKFTRSRDGVLKTEFTPRKVHQGFKGVVHGGIITTLLDEAMARLLLELGFPALTARLEVKFHKPAQLGEKLKVQAKLGKQTQKLFELMAFAQKANGELLAQAHSVFMRVKAVGRVGSNFLEKVG